jgi:hypothetical protein
VDRLDLPIEKPHLQPDSATPSQHGISVIPLVISKTIDEEEQSPEGFGVSQWTIFELFYPHGQPYHV